MKKILGVVIVVAVILIGLLGYKFAYKASPRDFITKDTKLIYANEGLATKDFKQLSQFIEDEAKKKEFEENLKKIKYVSKLYVFSDRELYQINDKNVVIVVDSGYAYPFYMTQISKYFDPFKDGIFVMKKNIEEKYSDQINDVYMYPYRGLFILSMKPKNIKEFIDKKNDYLYDKEIEGYIDDHRDNLLGVLLYNNSDETFYGIQYLTITGTVNKDKLELQQRFVLDNKAANKYKSTIENRELAKYIENNDVYLSPDDFSKMDNLIFNPYVIGQGFDKGSILRLWRGIFNIDLTEMLREIDGEAIIRNTQYGVSGIIKMKKDHPETDSFLELLKAQSGLLNLGKELNFKDNMLIIGEDTFKEQAKMYNIPKGTFLFGDMDIAPILQLPDLRVKILGKGNEIKVDVEMSAATIKEIERRY